VAHQPHDAAVLLDKTLSDVGRVITGTVINKNDLIDRGKGRECHKRIGD
jgi:hypothetical protein